MLNIREVADSMKQYEFHDNYDSESKQEMAGFLKALSQAILDDGCISGNFPESVRAHAARLLGVKVPIAMRIQLDHRDSHDSGQVLWENSGACYRLFFHYKKDCYKHYFGTLKNLPFVLRAAADWLDRRQKVENNANQ